MSTITQKDHQMKAIRNCWIKRKNITTIESSKGETINEGIMKQYTGGDKIIRSFICETSYFVHSLGVACIIIYLV